MRPTGCTSLIPRWASSSHATFAMECQPMGCSRTSVRFWAGTDESAAYGNKSDPSFQKAVEIHVGQVVEAIARWPGDLQARNVLLLFGL